MTRDPKTPHLQVERLNVEKRIRPSEDVPDALMLSFSQAKNISVIKDYGP